MTLHAEVDHVGAADIVVLADGTLGRIGTSTRHSLQHPSSMVVDAWSWSQSVGCMPVSQQLIRGHSTISTRSLLVVTSRY